MKCFVFLALITVASCQFFGGGAPKLPNPAAALGNVPAPGLGGIPTPGDVLNAASFPDKLLAGLDPVVVDGFKDFISKNKKTYVDESIAAKAIGIFKKNLEFVLAHNEKRAKGLVDFSMEVYSFMDEELQAIINFFCGTQIPSDSSFESDRRKRETKKQPPASSYPAGPASVNFTEFCLPVVEQGKCGSCWGFAPLAQLEALYKRNYSSDATPLSGQFLIDCDSTNTGCTSGWPKKALDYLKNNEVADGSSYPYKGEKGDCDKSAAKPGLSSKTICNTFQYELKGNEETLKNILAANGPVVVVVAVTEDFLAYKSGVFSDPNCPTRCKSINHSMLLVGYGTDAESGKDFWILRNSWGAEWGENGYIRLARNLKNNCLTSCFAIFAQLC